MADLMPFLVMNTMQAANFRAETASLPNRLDPRLVDAGFHAGKYALPKRVLFDPAHLDKRTALLMLTEVAMDIETAWPPLPEETE
jgi:hypothetical protein